MYDESSALKKAIRLSQTESSEFKERPCSAEPVMNVREKDTANYKLNYKQSGVNKEQEENTEIVTSIGDKMKGLMWSSLKRKTTHKLMHSEKVKEKTCRMLFST